MSANCVEMLHETSQKYKASSDNVHNTRTVTLVYFFEVTPLWNLTMVILCPVYNLKTVQDILMKLFVYAFNDDKQLIWVNFMWVSAGGVGGDTFFFVKNSSFFLMKIWNMKISEFLSENFQFFVVKFSVYLNRRVFVMLKLPSKYTTSYRRRCNVPA